MISCARIVGAVFLFDAEQASSRGFRLAAHFNSRSPQRRKKIRARDLFAEGQGERPQSFIERRDRVVADARNSSLAEVDHGERFENVVELGGGEIDPELL